NKNLCIKKVAEIFYICKMHKQWGFLFFLLICYSGLFAQKIILTDTISTTNAKDTLTTNVDQLYDINDGIKDIIRFVRQDTSTRVPKKRSGISTRPNVNHNPSAGAQIGAIVVGGMHGANPRNSAMSTYATALYAIPQGIIVG